jgi:geranylgeranyl diphosphate synthase, type I
MTTTQRSAHEVLAWSRTMVEPALRAAVDTLHPAARHVAAYHFGWADEHGRPQEANGGKAIRPALALLSAEAVNGSADDALPAAVAVELVHNFSLLHDDVMDGDVTRRHRKTAWAAFGVDAAILAGDALLTLALDVLARSGHPAAKDGILMLTSTVQDLVAGESADLAFERRTTVDVAECLVMAEMKTGALLGSSCAIGALFGGAQLGVAEQLRGFGRHVGLAFQHVDDLLGIWGDPAVTGKPVYEDLRRRKKNLPVVAALRSATPAGHRLAQLYQQDSLPEADLARAAELIELAGGRAWSEGQAERQTTEAVTLLAETVTEAGPLTDLSTLARLITRRNH